MADVPEMVERVARAIWIAQTSDLIRLGYMTPPFEEQSEAILGQLYRDARAAIAAMREPTEAMIVAGAMLVPVTQFGTHGESDRQDAALAYVAMIDAALTPA